MLTKKVAFEKCVKTPNSSGGNEESYELWFRCRASIKQKKSFRTIEDGYDMSVNDFTIRIPYRWNVEAEIDKDVRIVLDSRVMRILDWNIVGEKREEIEFNVEEVR